MQAKDSWGRSLWRINVLLEQFAMMARPVADRLMRGVPPLPQEAP